jgi:hypothetical protein
MKYCFLFFLLLTGFAAASQNNAEQAPGAIFLGEGQVPDLATGGHRAVHAVWGRGDSILYAFSSNGGKTFSAPELVDILPRLFSFAMRGPQVTAITGGACIIAGTQSGDLVAYQKTGAGPWHKTAKVNDVDTTAKEGFLDLGGDGRGNLFAAWLDIRKGRRNNIAGARSADGGKTWSANRLLYQSPGGHVCECCKPSVAVQGRRVSVMFRNWVEGNRDLWLLRSSNGGQSFAAAEKLGKNAWKLEGCPMDGGGLAYDGKGGLQTVWRRRDSVFAAVPGSAETVLGKGRSCTLAAVGNGIVYAWVENGTVILLTPGNKRWQLGKGSLPVVKAVGRSVVCVWEEEKKIRKALVTL